MKKIFKLRGELIVLFIVALFIGFITSAITGSITENIISKEDALRKTANKKNYEAVSFVKEELELESGDIEVIKNNINRIGGDPRLSYSFNIYLTDIEGNVVLSANNLKISKIDISVTNDVDLRIDNSSFNANNIIPINESYVIVFSHTGYCGSDIYMMPIWMLFSIIIFLILVRGRINYINKVSSEVQKIALGDLSVKVPLKYNNELTSLAENINYMAKELEDQDNKQKEFITNISHDLRTPLTTMLGYLKMIEEEKYSNNEELKKYISIINKKGIYLKGMIEDFFEYSKLVSKDIAIEKFDINLKESVMQLLDGEYLEFRKLGLDLEVDLPCENVFTVGDPILIARSFENLLNNSKKYSKENTKVKITLGKKNGYCSFKLRNVPQSKMSVEEVKLLFNRLYKKDISRKQQGSGLGLAITDEIIKNHKGYIHTRLVNEQLEFEIKLISKEMK